MLVLLSKKLYLAAIFNKRVNYGTTSSTTCTTFIACENPIWAQSNGTNQLAIAVNCHSWRAWRRQNNHVAPIYQKTYGSNPQKALYASMDHLYFSHHTLLELAEEFYKRGGECLCLDEVHKYEGWSREIKNIYDGFPELKIVFTGSSLLNILNAEADLSRRCVSYDMQGLSFREYLSIKENIHCPSCRWRIFYSTNWNSHSKS